MPGLSSATSMPSADRSAARPMPDSIMICGEPSAPAAMTTSPRHFATRTAPSWRKRTPLARLLVNSKPLDQAAGFQPQILAAKHRL